MIGFDPDFSTIFDDIYFKKRDISKKHSNLELRHAINRSTNKAKSKDTKRGSVSNLEIAKRKIVIDKTTLRVSYFFILANIVIYC